MDAVGVAVGVGRGRSRDLQSFCLGRYCISGLILGFCLFADDILRLGRNPCDIG